MKTSEEAKNALRAFGRDLAKPASREVASSSGRTERLGMRITLEVARRMAAACLYTPGMTLVDLVEQSVLREVARLERERGEPFPEVGEARPKRGRPLRR
ncbi:MAG: hypothetical protein WCH13_06965 [Deltaproteobacteria bacterium]